MAQDNGFPYTLEAVKVISRSIFDLKTIRQITLGDVFNDGQHDCIVMTGMKIDPEDNRTERLTVRAYELPRFIMWAIESGFQIRSIPEPDDPNAIVFVNPMGPFMPVEGSYV